MGPPKWLKVGRGPEKRLEAWILSRGHRVQWFSASLKRLVPVRITRIDLEKRPSRLF